MDIQELTILGLVFFSVFTEHVLCAGFCITTPTIH